MLIVVNPVHFKHYFSCQIAKFLIICLCCGQQAPQPGRGQLRNLEFGIILLRNFPLPAKITLLSFIWQGKQPYELEHSALVLMCSRFKCETLQFLCERIPNRFLSGSYCPPADHHNDN